MDRPTAEQLYRRYHLAIFRFLRKMSSSAEVAEDLTQDVFVRVIRGLETFDPRERDGAWLFRIARRLLTDAQRTARRRPTLVPESISNSPSIPPTQNIAAGLDEALRLVDGDEREAFLLRELGGLGYEEIAAISGATPDAIRNRIHRARCELRRALTPPSVVERVPPSRRVIDEL